MPALRADERLFDCFTLCDTQLRAGFGGAYALDWNAVRGAAIDMGIARDRTFYVLLKAFEETMIPLTRKKAAEPESQEQDRDDGQ